MDREELYSVLLEHKELLNSRGIEYFAASTSDYFEDSWKQYLEKCTLEELITLVNCKVPSESVPSSLKALKLRLKKLEFSRKCVENPRELWEKWTDGKKENSDRFQTEKFKVRSSSNGVRKRIKAKKQHEIDRIVELVSQIQTFHRDTFSEPIDSLVDIGAGVGHLSRMIALFNGLSVMAVEGNQQFTLSANSLDEKVLPGDFAGVPTRFTSFVTEELSLKIDEFAVNSAILVGLHCCGDFSSTILKVFQKSQKAKALVLFGCCYHKQFQSFYFLHPDKEHTPNVNCTVFPLSQKWAGFELGYLQREIACHNNENLKKRFREENIDLSRYARAHLEHWIWKCSDKPEDRNIGMCSVKCVENVTIFEEYIRKAMAKRGNHLMERVLKIIPPTTLSLCVSSLKRSLFDQSDVLRLMFAPPIESAILDDRVEFLRENGISARVVALFDANISPRNLAIVANKY